MDTHKAPPSITRREALRRGMAGAAGMALAGHSGLTARAAQPEPRAKAVIQIWMWGGPAHTDTFDPKPNAGYDYCGPLDKAIPTNVDGIEVGQSLPLLAQMADKYAIIRSMTHGNNGHETAAYMMQTGREPDRLVYPCIGAVVSTFRGYDQGYQGIVPPYVVLTEAQGRFSEAGFLGQRFKPFCTGGDPNKQPFAVEGLIAEGISDERQLGRRDLLHALDSLGKAMNAGGRAPNAQFERLDQCEEKAYGMMFGDARKLFDLSTEDESLRDRYGRHTFGQSCLMARRLVESGVPYVTINYKGWDTHKQHFEIMGRKLPEMDQGMSALLTDLSDRGLLDSTLVWWGGEFGRTPRVQWEAPWNGGRSHFGACFSVVLAGGGIQGGRVVGASDEKGEAVAERPVYPRDLLGTMYALLGIDPEGPLPNPKGMDVRVLPPAGEGVRSGGLLKEIMA